MKLYCTVIKHWPGLSGAELLTPERRDRMHRYRRREDQLRCLAAGLLLRHALGAAHACLQYGPNGKPFLPDGPHFNLSHAGDYVLLGVADEPLGVDVEHIVPWDSRVAARVFTPDEQAWLAAQPGDAPFYRLWTAKESLMKLTGQGLALPPETFSIFTVPCRLAWFDLPGHIACVARAESTGQKNVSSSECPGKDCFPSEIPPSVLLRK